MKQPLLKAFITLEHRDKNGKVLYREHRPSHSWVENYYCLVMCQASGNSAQEATYGLEFYEPDGTKKSYTTWCVHPYPAVDGFWGDMDSQGDIYGPVIGTGTGTETFTDYVLGTIIAHGAGSGQMVHSDMTRTYSLSGTRHKNKVNRTFTNNSGASITVNETGLYAESGYANDQMMINRDLISAIAVANSESLYVAYTIQLTFPE